MEQGTSQAIVLLAFVGLSVVWHIVEDKIHERKLKRAEVNPTSEPKRHSRLFLLLTPVSHPYVWDGIREFVVHLVVYSGHLLPVH